MSYFPMELILADFVSMIFLTLGALFLLRFFVRFGSPKSRRYSILTCLFIIIIATIHEGSEIAHGLYNAEMGSAIIAITIAASVLYLAAAIMLKKEMITLTTFRRKHGR